MVKKITQEIIDAVYEDTITGGPYPKKGYAKGVKKYHIKKDGTARENPTFKRLKGLPNVLIKTKAKFDIDLEDYNGKKI